MPDFAEMTRLRNERRAFMESPAGKLLNTFRSAVMREEQYGSNDDCSMKRLRELGDATKAAEAALITEIKRLQVLEAPE